MRAERAERDHPRRSRARKALRTRVFLHTRTGFGDARWFKIKGGRLLGEAWLRVGAIIAEFNMGCYGVDSGSARTDSQRAESARNPIAAHVKFGKGLALNVLTRTP